MMIPEIIREGENLREGWMSKLIEGWRRTAAGWALGEIAKGLLPPEMRERVLIREAMKFVWGAGPFFPEVIMFTRGDLWIVIERRGGVRGTMSMGKNLLDLLVGTKLDPDEVKYFARRIEIYDVGVDKKGRRKRATSPIFSAYLGTDLGVSEEKAKRELVIGIGRKVRRICVEGRNFDPEEVEIELREAMGGIFIRGGTRGEGRLKGVFKRRR